MPIAHVTGIGSVDVNIYISSLTHSEIGAQRTYAGIIQVIDEGNDSDSYTMDSVNKVCRLCDL